MVPDPRLQLQQLFEGELELVVEDVRHRLLEPTQVALFADLGQDERRVFEHFDLLGESGIEVRF